MKEDDSTIRLDASGKHFVRFIRRFEKGLKDFVIIYFVKEGEAPMEVVRFDCSHGFAHRDILYLPQHEKERKKGLPGTTLKEQMDYAFNDVFRNWNRYYGEHKRWKK